MVRAPSLRAQVKLNPKPGLTPPKEGESMETAREGEVVRIKEFVLFH